MSFNYSKHLFDFPKSTISTCLLGENDVGGWELMFGIGVGGLKHYQSSHGIAWILCCFLHLFFCTKIWLPFKMECSGTQKVRILKGECLTNAPQFHSNQPLTHKKKKNSQIKTLTHANTLLTVTPPLFQQYLGQICIH